MANKINNIFFHSSNFLKGNISNNNINYAAYIYNIDNINLQIYKTYLF